MPRSTRTKVKQQARETIDLSAPATPSPKNGGPRPGFQYIKVEPVTREQRLELIKKYPMLTEFEHNLLISYSATRSCSMLISNSDGGGRAVKFLDELHRKYGMTFQIP